MPIKLWELKEAWEEQKIAYLSDLLERTLDSAKTELQRQGVELLIIKDPMEPLPSTDVAVIHYLGPYTMKTYSPRLYQHLFDDVCMIAAPESPFFQIYGLYVRERDKYCRAIITLCDAINATLQDQSIISGLTLVYQLLNNSEDEKRLKNGLKKYFWKKNLQQSPHYLEWQRRRTEYGKTKQMEKQEKKRIQKSLVFTLRNIYQTIV